jgi:hypothetical protein
MQLSLEIYQLVISHVNDRADIASLCRVSRTCRYVAERALYKSLFMTQDSPATIPLCDSLFYHARVARFVETITIIVSEERVDNKYWSVVAKALRRTTQLRFLNVIAVGISFIRLSWILSGCTFRLRGLRSDLQWDPGLEDFLSKQSRLRNVSLAHYVHNRSHSSCFMPNLSIFESLSAEAAIDLIPRRPVSRVKTRFSRAQPSRKRDELARLCTSLQQSTQPILSLEIIDIAPTEAFTLETLSYIVASFVRSIYLQYLGTLMLPVRGIEVCSICGRYYLASDS